jgi:hypothetical protein
MLNKFTVTGSDFKRLQLLPLKHQSIEGYITLHNVLHNLMRVLIIAPICQVLVHSPFDYPEVSGKGLAVNYRKEVFVGVSAKYVERFKS